MKTKTTIKKAQAKVKVRRARREYPHVKQRSARTYYAATKDGSTLFRFANHAQRLNSIRQDKLIPIGALDFRTKVAEDVDGRLSIIDKRKDALVSDQVEQQAMPAVGLPEAIAAAVAAVLNPYLARIPTGTVAGEQPRASRVANQH